MNLAVIDRLDGNYQQARDNLNEAIGIYVELGIRRGEADAYAELAATAEAAGGPGDLAMALIHRQRADMIYEELRQSR